MSQQFVKGTGLIPVVAYVKDRYGDDGWENMLQRIPQPTREILAKRILQITWYPHETVSTLYTALCDEFGNGDPKFSWGAGKASADYGLSVIYKLFLRLGSPMMFGNKSPEIWKTYYQPSRMEIVKNDKGAIVVVLRDLRTSEAHLYSIAGWIERAGELTGGKNIKINVDIPGMRYDIAYE